MNPEEQSSSQNSMPERQLVVPSGTVHPSLVLSGFNFKYMPSETMQKSFIDQVIKPNMDIYMTTLDDSIAWIRMNYNPDDIFSTTELAQWAESEGYIKSKE